MRLVQGPHSPDPAVAAHRWFREEAGAAIAHFAFFFDWIEVVCHGLLIFQD
jgi:hypothetical protein